MFLKQSKIPTRSVSNISGHSKYSGIPTVQSKTINAIWDINQIGQELDCTDDPQLSEALEMINNKQVNQAILYFNQIIYEGKRYLGQQSQVQQVTKVTLVIVSSAMSILENDPASALLLLLGCEQLFRGLTQKQQGYLRVQVFNGLGCYYRRVGQMEKALKELECALAIIRKYNLKEVAVTHLNLSVVLSLIEEHEGALENAKKAVTESHKEYQYYIKNHVSMSQFKFQRCVSSLAIAFYNVGVQEQHFQRYQFALQAYASAFKVAEDNLGQQHYLTLQLKNIYEEFARQLAIAEAQKIAITSLHHKFQIKPNIQSQYAQSVLRSQQSDTKKITERLFQSSDQKRISHPLRPQSAIVQTKVKSFEVLKRDGFNIKKQWSATNRSVNQITEESQKAEEQAKHLQENIENLKNETLKEQQELERIKLQKQRELQKLEAFRYINQQIQKQKNTTNSVQTSREYQTQQDIKQFIHTDPQIQDDLNDSEPQPLVAQIIINGETKTEEIEEKTDQIYSQHISIQQQNQSEIFDSAQKNTNFEQQISCKQIDDLEEIKEEEIINNQQQIEQVVEQIIQQKAEQIEEQNKINMIIKIQIQWKISQTKLEFRIKQLQSQFLQCVDMKYQYILDENQIKHNGYLIIGWNLNNLVFIFIDLYCLRKSNRKCIDIQQQLNHILKLEFNSNISMTHDLIDQLSNLILPFIFIQNKQLNLQFKQEQQFIIIQDENQNQIQCDLQKQDIILIENITINNILTVADIQQVNQELTLNKIPMLSSEQLQPTPFQNIKSINSMASLLDQNEKIDDQDQQQQISNEQINQNKFEQKNSITEFNKFEQKDSITQLQGQTLNDQDNNEPPQSEESDKINETGQFHTQTQQSRQDSQNELDKKGSEELQVQNNSKKQILENNSNLPNLDFTLQLNDNNSQAGSIMNSQNFGEVENNNNNNNNNITNSANFENKDKNSQNNTIMEEDEEEKNQEEEKRLLINTEKSEIKSINSKNELKSQLNPDNEHHEAYFSNNEMSDQEQDKQSNHSKIQQKSSISSKSSKSSKSNKSNKSNKSEQEKKTNNEKQLFKQVSIQLPDLMKDEDEKENSENSQQQVSLLIYERFGQITGINKINGTLFLVSLFVNKEKEQFQAKAEEYKVKPTYFKVEKIDKVLKKPQKFLKGFLVEWCKEMQLKVYTKAHEKAVLKLQKKFKFDHYRRHFTFRLLKSNIEGGIYVGSRKQIIYMAIETKQTMQRNSYIFRGENYSQFVHRISFRILNNLKYSEEKGIYLLQEPEHRILAQNLQSKIFKLQKPSNAFDFLGYGLLNGIYDTVHKKIIIASDNRKIEAAQVDVPKSIQPEQLVQFARYLLERSFIIQTDQETCVIYYEQKDEENVKLIQTRLFEYQTIRTITIQYITAIKGELISKQITIELQKKLKKWFRIKCEEKIEEIGQLDEKSRKQLLIHFRKLAALFIIYQDNEITIDVQSIQEFIQNGEFVNMLRMDIKDQIVH